MWSFGYHFVYFVEGSTLMQICNFLISKQNKKLRTIMVYDIHWKILSFKIHPSSLMQITHVRCVAGNICSTEVTEEGKHKRNPGSLSSYFLFHFLLSSLHYLPHSIRQVVHLYLSLWQSIKDIFDPSKFGVRQSRSIPQQLSIYVTANIGGNENIHCRSPERQIWGARSEASLLSLVFNRENPINIR